MYSITFTIDMQADSPLEAAKKAYNYMRESTGPVLEVTDKNNKAIYLVDLSEADADALTQIG